MDVEADAVLKAVNRILGESGLDAAALGMQIVEVGDGLVVFFDAPRHDLRSVVVSRIAVRLNAEEARDLVEAGRYAPPEVVGSTIDGPIIAIGGNLPAALGLEIDALVAAARTSH